MMVPKQLANTMEFIFERSMPPIGAVAKMVIGPPAGARNPQDGEEVLLNNASSMPDRPSLVYPPVRLRRRKAGQRMMAPHHIGFHG
jgi:hypothetical protein